MIFKNETEAIAWLAGSGIHCEISVDEGGSYLHRWTFSLPGIKYVSEPPPFSRPSVLGADEDAKVDAERLEKHKPKTFLEAVNLFAGRLLGGLKTDVKGSE